jgi:hypothetical protein
LNASGELPELQRRHAAVLLDVVRRAEPLLLVPAERTTWMMRLERDKCALIAEHRADMWETTIENDPLSPTSTHVINEARDRHKEAIVIADAIRFDHATADG